MPVPPVVIGQCIPVATLRCRGLRKLEPGIDSLLETNADTALPDVSRETVSLLCKIEVELPYYVVRTGYRTQVGDPR